MHRNDARGILIKLFKETPLSQSDVSRETGIPQSTINRIYWGITKSPRQDQVNKLLELSEKYLAAVEADNMNGTIDKLMEHITELTKMIKELRDEKREMKEEISRLLVEKEAQLKKAKGE